MAITKLKALGVTDGTLTNTQINASAAIASSKLGTISANKMPTGSVIQVQTTNAKPSVTTTTSTSFIDLGISTAITPSSSSSKILVLKTLGFYMYGGGTDVNINTIVQRDIGGAGYSTLNIGRTAATTSGAYMNVGSGDAQLADYQSFSFLDTPSTTSACTYKLQGCLAGAGGTCNFNLSSDSYANLTLLEIQG